MPQFVVICNGCCRKLGYLGSPCYVETPPRNGDSQFMRQNFWPLHLLIPQGCKLGCQTLLVSFLRIVSKCFLHQWIVGHLLYFPSFLKSFISLSQHINGAGLS